TTSLPSPVPPSGAAPDRPLVGRRRERPVPFDSRRNAMEMLLASERRASRRAVDVGCQVVRERGFVLLSERGADLSPDRMLAPSPAARPAPAPPGAPRAWSPGEETSPASPPPAPGRGTAPPAPVPRVARAPRRGDGGPPIGLRFPPLSSEDARLVRWALR